MDDVPPFSLTWSSLYNIIQYYALISHVYCTCTYSDEFTGPKDFISILVCMYIVECRETHQVANINIYNVMHGKIISSRFRPIILNQDIHVIEKNG